MQDSGGKEIVKMANIELIRKFHYVEKRSIRQLSKDLGIHDRRSGKHWNRMRFLAIPNSPHQTVGDRCRQTVDSSVDLSIYREIKTEKPLNGFTF